MLQTFSRRTLMTSIRNLKKSLRKEIKDKVATISQESKALQSEIVKEKVLNSYEYESAASMSVYLHMDDEIRTNDILIQALKDGKICYIPR